MAYRTNPGKPTTPVKNRGAVGSPDNPSEKPKLNTPVKVSTPIYSKGGGSSSNNFSNSAPPPVDEREVFTQTENIKTGEKGELRGGKVVPMGSNLTSNKVNVLNPTQVNYTRPTSAQETIQVKPTGQFELRGEPIQQSTISKSSPERVQAVERQKQTESFYGGLNVKPKTFAFERVTSPQESQRPQSSYKQFQYVPSAGPTKPTTNYKQGLSAQESQYDYFTPKPKLSSGLQKTTDYFNSVQLIKQGKGGIKPYANVLAYKSASAGVEFGKGVLDARKAIPGAAGFYALTAVNPTAAAAFGAFVLVAESKNLIGEYKQKGIINTIAYEAPTFALYGAAGKLGQKRFNYVKNNPKEFYPYTQEVKFIDRPTKIDTFKTSAVNAINSPYFQVAAPIVGPAIISYVQDKEFDVKDSIPFLLAGKVKSGKSPKSKGELRQQSVSGYTKSDRSKFFENPSQSEIGMNIGNQKIGIRAFENRQIERNEFGKIVGKEGQINKGLIVRVTDNGLTDYYGIRKTEVRPIQDILTTKKQPEGIAPIKGFDQSQERNLKQFGAPTSIEFSTVKKSSPNFGGDVRDFGDRRQFGSKAFAGAIVPKDMAQYSFIRDMAANSGVLRTVTTKKQSAALLDFISSNKEKVREKSFKNKVVGPIQIGGNPITSSNKQEQSYIQPQQTQVRGGFRTGMRDRIMNRLSNRVMSGFGNNNQYYRPQFEDTEYLRGFKPIDTSVRFENVRQTKNDITNARRTDVGQRSSQFTGSSNRLGFEGVLSSKSKTLPISESSFKFGLSPRIKTSSGFDTRTSQRQSQAQDVATIQDTIQITQPIIDMPGNNGGEPGRGTPRIFIPTFRPTPGRTPPRDTPGRRPPKEPRIEEPPKNPTSFKFPPSKYPNRVSASMLKPSFTRKFRGTPSLSYLGTGYGIKLTKKQMKGGFISPFQVRKV